MTPPDQLDWLPRQRLYLRQGLDLDRATVTKLLDEVERLSARNGWGFIGPCVHGRDPYDRCDECSLLEPHEVAVAVEREACARVAEKLRDSDDAADWQLCNVADAIRSRGDTEGREK